MSGAKVGFGDQRNEYGYPVLESDDEETTYRRGMSGDHGWRSPAQAMMAHKVTGVIMGLIFALGLIGWLWTFVNAP